MQSIREDSVNKNFLLIFAIILCIYPLFMTAEIRTFSYDEEKDYGQTAPPRVWNLKTYDDGTAVARIVRQNTNKSCFYEMLSLRIIHPNGTVDEKDIKLGIPSFNYCVFQNGTEFLDYNLIRKNHILVIYYNYTTNYEEWGMVIDFDGKVFDRKQLEKVVIGKSKIQLNINREKGFLKINHNTTTITWTQYIIRPDGKLTFIFTSGTTYLETFTTVSTLDEGYAIVYMKPPNSSRKTGPLLPRTGLFILFINDHLPGSELLLYQYDTCTTQNFSALSCDISLIEHHVCVLSILQEDHTGDKIFYAKVNFLTSGSNIFIESIDTSFSNIPNNGLNNWAVKSLLFGGHMLTNTTNNSIYGFLFNGSDYTPWEFPEPVPTNLNGVFQVLSHNNTLLVAQMETNNSWKFQVIDLPKRFDDKGYFNPNVVVTCPTINSSIDPNTSKISINFTDYVTLSLNYGNLSIYQVIDDQPYLRQFIPGKECNIPAENISAEDILNGKNSLKDKKVSADVSESTFSVYKGNYFIKMDNSLVRNSSNNEPLLGIRENVWSFTTIEKKDTLKLSTITGLLRIGSVVINSDNLTFDGTHEFVNWERTKFFDKLLEELSIAIPIKKSRLTTNRITQLDRSVNKKQYLISITIKAEKDDNVSNITSVIDSMVKNKSRTLIGVGLTTKYLDNLYGFKQLQNFWKRDFAAFLVAGLLIVLFFNLFLFAQRKNSHGNNIAILQFGVIIFDLILDILFVSRNANDVPVLYLLSVLSITISIGINTILAFHIITRENATRPRFHRWFTAHEKIANIIIILAAIADIKALDILHSNLAGFTFFRAPSFSETSKSKIFWGTCLNFFIEDIPQVTIQIFYLTSVLTYGVIPLLTLISSAINLTINGIFIMGGLYKSFDRLYTNRQTVTVR